jgi:hypothetical protein
MMLEFSSSKPYRKIAVSATASAFDLALPEPKNSTVGFANGQFGRR